MAGDRNRERLASLVEDLDAISLASVIGGLLLLPKNLHHVHRFQALANMVAAGRARGKRDVTAKGLQRVHEALGEWTGIMDDPWPNLAVEAFVYHGGTHLFIPGGIDTLFVLRALARAAEGISEPRSDFAPRAARIIQFACALSDDLLSTVAAKRNEMVPDPSGVSLPGGQRLRALREAVCLAPERFGRLRSTAAVSRQDAERFCRSIGSVDEPDPRLSHLFLTHTPLVRRGDEVVAVAPHLLAEAAVRAVLDLSRETGSDQNLSERFHLVSFIMADEALELLRLRAITPPRKSFTSPAGSHVSHVIYQCDRDKAHHVMFASDGLVGDCAGKWDTTLLATELTTAQEALPAILRQVHPHVSAWTSIVVTTGIGRDFSLRLHRSPIRTWAINSGDVEAIAYAEERDSLLIWKFQDGLEEAEKGALLSSWSPLDTYSLWRRLGRRFVGDQDGPPMSISIPADMGMVVRGDAATKRDWRGLVSWNQGTLVEVGLAEDRALPVYLPRYPSRQRICVAVETSGPLVWFTTPAGRDLGVRSEIMRTHAEIGRMFSFWCAELSSYLDESLAAFPTHDPIVVEYEYFDEGGPVHENGYLVESQKGVPIRVAIAHRFYETYNDTNAAERRLVAVVMTTILAAAGVEGAEDLVRGALDAVAPVGPKRMLHAIPLDRHPALQGGKSLPRERHVDDFDLHRARAIARSSDVVGQTLRGDECRHWLNAAVGRMYDALRSDIALYAGSSLVQQLLARHEALVLEGAQRDMMLTSILACAERLPKAREQIVTQINRHARASVATRFLVEFVAAEPPQGAMELSTATFDAWLALAAEIIELGAASDVAKYELADVSIRLGRTAYELDLGGYDLAVVEGRGRVHSERFDLELERRGVRDVGPVPPSPAPLPTELTRMSTGVRAEFGCGIEDLASFFRETLALAYESEKPVVAAPRKAFLTRVATRLGWSESAVDSCLSHFSLTLRPRFVDPPASYRSADLWPWIFNRGLSYIRRPFIRRPDDDICFTPGHLTQAWINLMMLLTTGRFKSQTPELRAAMDQYVQAPARAFAEQVGRILKERGLIVATHVSKVAGKRIEAARGRSLGDIDVLVAHTAKRRIIAIECKDLQLDRMPHEISSDIRDLFVGSSSKLSAQDRHLARLAWLRDRQDDVVKWLVGASTKGWRIDAALATSRALVSPYLGRAKMPVWTLHQLRRGEGP